MITDLNKTQNSIPELKPLPETRYENIFKVVKTDKYFFYNIIKKISFPDDIERGVYLNIRPSGKMPWTTFSNNVYGTQELWWLICLLNKVQNPITGPIPGTVYKVIKPDFVNVVLAELTKQL